MCSVVTYDTCVVIVKEVGIGELNSQQGLKLYPNPVVDGQLMVEIAGHFDRLNDHRIEIYNTMGECVLQTTLQQNVIDVSKLNGGVYFVHLRTKNGLAVKKVVIN